MGSELWTFGFGSNEGVTFGQGILALIFRSRAFCFRHFGL